MGMVSCKECTTDFELADPKENDGCCQDCGEGPFCASCLENIHECGEDDSEDDDEEDDDEEDDDEEESESE